MAILMDTMSTTRLKVYSGELLSRLSYLPFMRINLAPGTVVLNAFSEPDAFSSITDPFFDIVTRPEDADYLLIPYNYFHIKGMPEIISHFENLSETLGKKILVFALGDRDEKVPVKNSIVFRTSQYRSQLATNEVMVPAFVPDMVNGKEIIFRTKGEKPIIGFCGWASFENAEQKMKFIIKNFLISLKALFLGSHLTAHKQGIYFRLKALAVFSHSDLVKTNFIIRKTYSANKKTLEGDPLVMRKEYIDNILNSDFALAPKGDGNYSVRFYEALCLGRIPLLIDTDTVLPLEKSLCYDEFVLKIDYKDLHKAPQIVRTFYDGLTDDLFVKMQKKAREAYEHFLSPQVFLKRVFTKDFLISYETK